MSFKKNYEKSRRKSLREEYNLKHPPPYTEGIWEENMLENHRYYDIDILNKTNANTIQGIKHWEEKYKNASSWIGKWAYQTKIDKLKKKLKRYGS